MALNNDLKDIPFIKMKNHLQRNILENEVIVGTGFLSLRGLEIGETLTIPNFFGKMQNFKIVGVFEAEADLLTKDLLLVSPKNARQIIGLKEHEITDLGLDLYNPNEIQNLARKIDQNFSSVRVVTLPQLQATYQTLFGWRGGIWVYGSILAMLAFVLLIWEKATGFDEKEKKELGILKALGWQIKEVLWVKFWESFVIAFTASLIGILMAIFHVFVLEAPLLKPFLVGWSVLYPSFRLYPYVDLNSILMILSLAIFPYLFATLIPAWRGAITDPSEIMRG
jgi:ABC-type lipoprotein release transport system permease subunit